MYGLTSIARAAASLFDRSRQEARGTQDALINAGFFAAAVFAMHRWGHKLAV